MTKLNDPVLMATVGAAQGLRGDVRVRCFTANPLTVGDYGNLHAEDGRTFEILETRPGKNNMIVIRFRGVNDRDAAEAIRGLNLYVEREHLPDEELDDEEYFYADLEGLDVVDGEGNSYGAVSAIFDFGAGDLLELKGPGRRPVLIPFNERAVLEVDFEDGRIVIDPVAAGLAGGDDEGPEGFSGRGSQ